MREQSRVCVLRDANLQRAKSHYGRAYNGLVALGGFRCDTPLNNLGLLAVLEGNWAEASSYFAKAEAGGHDPHTALFVQSNYAVCEALQGKLPRAIERLQVSVAKADLTGDLFYRDCLRHNLARALLEAGRAGEAYETAIACDLHHSSGDELLVRGKRASLLIDALTAQGLPSSDQLFKDAAVLERTTKPQAWLYQAPWYYTDIEFWED